MYGPVGCRGIPRHWPLASRSVRRRRVAGPGHDGADAGGLGQGSGI